MKRGKGANKLPLRCQKSEIRRLLCSAFLKTKVWNEFNTQKIKPTGILADRYCYGFKEKKNLLFILWEFEFCNRGSALIFWEGLCLICNGGHFCLVQDGKPCWSFPKDPKGFFLPSVLSYGFLCISRTWNKYSVWCTDELLSNLWMSFFF